MHASSRRRSLVVSGLLASLAVVSVSPPAHAETVGPAISYPIAPPSPNPSPSPTRSAPAEPRELEPVAGARIGIAIPTGVNLNTDPGGFRGTINPQQLGLQGDLGYSFANGLFIGAALRVFLGQKVSDDVLMTQQGVFCIGYARPTREFIAIRPLMELGWQRYHFETTGAAVNDAGFLMAFGGAVVADVREHFYLISMVRLGFAAMGDGGGDLTVSAGSIDVYGQAILGAGLRF